MLVLTSTSTTKNASIYWHNTEEVAHPNRPQTWPYCIYTLVRSHSQCNLSCYYNSTGWMHQSSPICIRNIRMRVNNCTAAPLDLNSLTDNFMHPKWLIINCSSPVKILCSLPLFKAEVRKEPFYLSLDLLLSVCSMNSILCLCPGVGGSDCPWGKDAGPVHTQLQCIEEHHM